MKESIQQTKQLARTIQESGMNQRVGFVDNRQFDLQKLGAIRNVNYLVQGRFCSLNINNEVIQKTEADNITREHPNWSISDEYALIGSDNEYQSLVGRELRECIDLGMQMPAYLSRYLRDTRTEFSQDANDDWIDIMSREGRVFVVLHNKISRILSTDNYRTQIENVVTTKRRDGEDLGTWGEVLRLLDAGYVWYPIGEMLLPPGLTPEELEARFD